MNKAIYVALNDLSVTFRERGVWINLLVIPVILIFAVGVANGAFGGGGTPRQIVDVFDNDNTDLSAEYLNTLRQINSTLVLCPLDEGQITDDEGAVVEDVCQLGEETLTPELAQQRVEDGVTEATIEIPAGFQQAVIDGQPLDIVYRSEEDPTQPSGLLQTVQAAAQRVSAASVAAQTALQVYEESGFEFVDDEDRLAFRQAAYDQASGQWQAPPATVAFTLSGETDESGSTAGNGFRQSVPGMGTMYVMFTVLAGATALIIERKNWTLQRLATMPVSRAQLLGGKLLARFLMGMIQYSVAFGFGLLLGVLFDFTFGGNLAGLLLVMVAFAMCMSALTFLIATFVDNEMQAAGISTFISLTLAPLGGAWWPLEIVPDFMRIVGHISPVAWAMDGFNKLLFYNGTIVDILPEVGVLLLMTVVLFAVAVRRFKIE